MHHFRYAGQNLHCESVDLAEVARLYGTPTYVYSAATIADNYARLVGSMPGLDVRVCYSLKANSNLAVVRHLSNLGSAFDFVSAGEMRRVLAAGASVKESVFAGVGKTDAEIRLALEAGIFSFHVESEPELGRLNHVAGKLGRGVREGVCAGVGKTDAEIRLALEAGIFSFHVESEPELGRLNHVAGKLGVRAPIALRVNPDVDANTHAKITTGTSASKFGIPIRQAAAAYEAASKYPNIAIKGIQTHIGSQITEVAPFVEALEKLAPLAADLKERRGISYISIGGGIGVVYRDALASGPFSWWETQPEGKRPLTSGAYGAALAPMLKALGLRVLLEPGRSMVANAGVLHGRE